MGYNSRIYVVEKRAWVNPEFDKHIGSVIVAYNAGCFPELRKFFSQPTNCYIYSDDGDTALLEDKYGDVLTEASVGSVVSFLESLDAETANYRRVFPLLSLLRSFQKSEGDWHGLSVLHYGT